VLSVEAIQANDGDCLLLRSDAGANPALILIDGGSRGVYRNFLAKRLEQLRANLPALQLRMVIVSHIDADHITGIIDMFKYMSELVDEGQRSHWEVTSLWHNAFEKTAGSHPAVAQTATIVTAATGGVDAQELERKGFTREASAVIASVKQGKDLQAYAKRITTINKETNGKLIVAPRRGRYELKITSHLTFTVLGPLQAELDDLQKEWAKSKANHEAEEHVVVADFLNRTIPNLSSIVFLAEERNENEKSTRMLLTGDAGGDYILKGLESADLLDAEGRIAVDVLKLQHHGSNHSVDETFFRRVIAESYVISGNGKHGIPHMDTLCWLSNARKDQQYAVYMTNRHLQNGEKDLTPDLDAFLNREARFQPKHHYHFLPEGQLAIAIRR
jgi:beta-lactamase superfamily II metal-dependent hydrolase